MSSSKANTAIVAAFAASVVAAAPLAANADSTAPQPVPAAFEIAATGSPVTFNIGRGIDEDGVKHMAAGVEERGCPVTIDNSGRPRRITVSTNGKTHSFPEPTSAASWALEFCGGKS